MVEQPLLAIESLSKIYDDEKDRNKWILNNVNLTVSKKEFLTILGPSGCGKTTLLRCIGGFEDYFGSIKMKGRIINKPGKERVMVFQDYNQLFPWKTVEKNIQFPLRLQGEKDKYKLARITYEYLEKVNLHGIEKKYPYQLSGGMKQRVAIARAMVQKPDLILMDEPFAALDAMTRNKLQSEIFDIVQKEDSTVLFVTHNVQEAIVLGTRIIVMSEEGKIILDEKNPLPKPTTPSSEGYGSLWGHLHKVLFHE